MYWWYLLLILGAVVYFGYRRYLLNKQRKQAAAPKCEVCGSPMEMQIKQGDSEIWTCPKCNPIE